MGRGTAGLLAAILALCGCRNSADTRPADRPLLGALTSRTKDKSPEKDDNAQTWLKTKGNGSDESASLKDAISGKVVDSFNRPAKNIFIRVEPVSGTPRDGAALGIQTDDSGIFFTQGLKPGTTYTLTAEATLEGKQLRGVVQTRVPNPSVTIVLRENAGLPPEVTLPPPKQPTHGLPPPPVPGEGDRIPPMSVAPPPPARRSPDGAFQPGGTSPTPVPPAIGGSGSPKPAPTPGSDDPLPPPDDLANPVVPSRPENVAEGPRTPFTPPTASIPGPPVPRLPSPPPSPPAPTSPQSRGGNGANFRLIDTLEREWNYPANQSGDVVLLEFVTTSCPHCKPAVPILKGLQSKYGVSGLQVIAVLCDDVPQQARASAASKYGREQDTNYSVFVEPGELPGSVRDALGVEAYPTVVLLNASGKVVFSGHPVRERAKLESAVRQALQK